MEDSFQNLIWPLQVLVMFSGLTNAQATSQDYINKILEEKLNVLIIVYFNNISIYTVNKRKIDLEAVSWVFYQL